MPQPDDTTTNYISIADHDRRVSELLEENNKLLNRAREADAQNKIYREIALRAVQLAGDIAKMMKVGQ